MLWNNFARHDGRILCGCFFKGVLTLDDSDNMDLDSAIPIGTPAFIDNFLGKYKDKITRLIDTIVDIPSVCSPGRLAIQSANLMLRHCCAQKATYLLRLLPPRYTRELAGFVDKAIVDGFCRLNGLAGNSQLSQCQSRVGGADSGS